MPLNERTVRLTIQKFSDCLDWCCRHRYSKDMVVRFFGKKRAANWCGSFKGYPDLAMIRWYEERYNKVWEFPKGLYYDESRFLLPAKDRCYKNCN